MSKILTFRLENDLEEKLNEYCVKNDRNVSSAIRYALRKVLTDEGEQK